MVHAEGKDDKLEVWKDKKDYEGLYQASNLGRVRSVDRWVKCSNGSVRLCKGKILKTSTNNQGYLQVGLYKNGKVKKFLVHRLVAEAFIPNTDNLPQVNHKDENPQNNNVDNLEWCDRTYNINYGTAIERMKKHQHSKPVLQYTLDGQFVKEWESLAEAHQNGFHRSHIIACCRGKRKKHKDSIWKYK